MSCPWGPLEVPGLHEHAPLFGLRVQWAGEEGVDIGGVRKDFLDSFAEVRPRPARAVRQRPLPSGSAPLNTLLI